MKRNDRRPRGSVNSVALHAGRLRRRIAGIAALLLCIALSVSSNARAGTDRQWYLRASNPTDLIHGVKETDDQDFFAGCEPRSGRVVLILTQGVKTLADGGEVPVSIAVDDRSRQFAARGAMNADLGVPVPVIHVDADDPLFDWMAGGYELHVTITGALDESISLHGSARAVRNFIAACRK